MRVYADIAQERDVWDKDFAPFADPIRRELEMF